MKKLRSELNSANKHWKLAFFCVFCIMTILYGLPVFSANDPVADFTADQTSGCQGLVVVFTDKSVDAEK